MASTFRARRRNGKKNSGLPRPGSREAKAQRPGELEVGAADLIEPRVDRKDQQRLIRRVQGACGDRQIPIQRRSLLAHGKDHRPRPVCESPTVIGHIGAGRRVHDRAAAPVARELRFAQ